MSHSQKISSFTTQSILADSDLFTLISGATNKNITFSSFKLALGVTGTLAQVGAPLGVPVLDTVGTVNGIRNLESTKGVTASVSAQNGISLAANFSQPVGGFSLIEDLNAKIYNFRGVKGISPIDVNLVNGFLEFSSATSPLAQTNTVIVSDISDFPAPAAGVITLDDDINYVIVQAITTSNRFVLGANNSITSNNPLSPLFTYTGTGTMFTGVDVNLTMHDIFLSAPFGQIFDMKGVSNDVFLLLTLVIVLSCDKYATLDNLRTFDVTNSSVLSANEGITVLGNVKWNIFSVSKFSMITTSATFEGVDFGVSVHNTVEFINFIVRGVSGTVAIKGATNSANMNVDQLATVTNSEFTGGITPLSGIDLTDIRWNFKNNAGLHDSLSDGLLSLLNNALVTTIPSPGTQVKVNAVWVTEALSHFESDGTGRLTYVAERDARMPIDIQATFLMVSGGSKQVTGCIAINGSPILQTGEQVTASSSQAGSVTLIWQHTFKQGHFIELFCENNDDSVNMICQQGVERIQ